jgi:B12-binding domain/radical SAM domain protein
MLRVLALAPPQFAVGDAGSLALNSADPASLYNACRLAALEADQRIGVWGDSNWAVNRLARRESILLLNDWAQAQMLLPRKLAEIEPNLVLIGAMSICFRGAFECARLIKKTLGENVCVVLGGRHSNETIWQDKETGAIRHHPASPIRLMAEEIIDPVFDIVVSGDGESVIVEIGKLIGHLTDRNIPAAMAADHFDEIGTAPGEWIATSIRNGSLRSVVGRNRPLDYSQLVTPSQVFGVKAHFDVFAGKPTAHVFSDVGRGCIYNCNYCSENIDTVGAPRQMNTSAQRLGRYLKIAQEVIAEDYQNPAASAFCEDSTLLGGSPKLLDEFCRFIEQQDIHISLGAQLTVDQVLRESRKLPALRRAGLEYLFIGLETPDPELIGGMSKDIGRNSGRSWLDRNRAAFEAMMEADIMPGISLLFGLGERQADRELLFRHLTTLRSEFGQPSTISMNWAVQHPLRGKDGGTNYQFTEWAIPEGELLEVLRNFGEASTCYPLCGQPAPCLSEATEVVDAVRQVLGTPPNGIGHKLPIAL